MFAPLLCIVVVLPGFYTAQPSVSEAVNPEGSRRVVIDIKFPNHTVTPTRSSVQQGLLEHYTHCQLSITMADTLVGNYIFAICYIRADTKVSLLLLHQRRGIHFLPISCKKYRKPISEPICVICG